MKNLIHDPRIICHQTTLSLSLSRAIQNVNFYWMFEKNKNIFVLSFYEISYWYLSYSRCRCRVFNIPPNFSIFLFPFSIVLQKFLIARRRQKRLFAYLEIENEKVLLDRKCIRQIVQTNETFFLNDQDWIFIFFNNDYFYAITQWIEIFNQLWPKCFLIRQQLKITCFNLKI